MKRFVYQHHPRIRERPGEGPVEVDDLQESLNDRLARRGTLAFGSMPTFYIFVVYGALGAVFTSHQSTLLYWSNWIQLWSLPLLMVGAVVLGKASDARSKQQFADTEMLLHEMGQMQQHITALEGQLMRTTAALQAIGGHMGITMPPPTNL